MSDLQVTEIVEPPRPSAPTGGDASRPWARDVLAALAVLLVVYLPTVASLPVVWWQRDGYVQGFLLAALVIYVLWRDRDRILPPAAEPSPPLAPVLAGLGLLWMALQIMSVQVGTQTVLLVLITLWGIQVLGLRSWPVLVPAGATFLLGIPIVDSFIPVLRAMAVVMSGLFVSLLRIPAEIQGDEIIIEWGSFVVENGCAGHGYLLVGLTLGVAYSHLFMRGWRTRLGVVGLAGVIALFSNWVRIAHLVWLGHSTQMQSPTITDHAVHGWVVFTLALIPFFALARWMERWNAPRTAADEGTEAAEGAGRRGPDSSRWHRRLALATAAAAVGPLLFYLGGLLPSADTPEAPITPAGGDWVELPDDDGAVTAEGPTRTWEIEYAGVDHEDITRWVRGDGSPPVVGQRLIYTRQRQGAELINSVNRIAPDSVVFRQRRVGPLDANGTSVREAWIRSGDREWLVWYRYRVAGVTTASSIRAKLLELFAFVTRRRQAELVALTAPCGTGGCPAAAGRLYHFITGNVMPSGDDGAVGR